MNYKRSLLTLIDGEFYLSSMQKTCRSGEFYFNLLTQTINTCEELINLKEYEFHLEGSSKIIKGSNLFIIPIDTPILQPDNTYKTLSEIKEENDPCFKYSNEIKTNSEYSQGRKLGRIEGYNKSLNVENIFSLQDMEIAFCLLTKNKLTLNELIYQLLIKKNTKGNWWEVNVQQEGNKIIKITNFA